jgi:predicted transcriptional regulator
LRAATTKPDWNDSAAASLHNTALEVLMAMYEAHPKKLSYDDFMFSRDAISTAMKDLRDKGLVVQEGKQNRNVLTAEGLKQAERHKKKSLKSD